MSKIVARKVSSSVGNVKGIEVPVELEPLGQGQRFRWLCVLGFTAIFIASLLIPTILLQGVFNKTVLDGEVWRVITYAFLHGGWVHLAMNMLALFVFARVVQMHYGRTGMVALFFVTSVFAVVPELLFRPEVQMVGASGGLMGFWGAQVAAAIRLREVPKTFRKLTEQLSLGTLVTYFAVQVVLDHVIPNVAYWAHLGGFASGLALGAVLPLYGASRVYISRRQAVSVKKVTVHDVVGSSDNDRFQEVVVALQPGFDPQRDFVVREHDRLGAFDRRYTTSEVMAGRMPFANTAEWQQRVLLASSDMVEGIGGPQKVIDVADEALRDHLAAQKAKASSSK